MAVRDVLWACPVCRTPGGIRRGKWRTESCQACGTRFRRGRGAAIVAERGTSREERPVRDWLDGLGAVRLPTARPDGTVLGPEPVRVKRSRAQRALRFGSQLLGWVELYDKPVKGAITLQTDRLSFQPEAGSPTLWPIDALRGIQPASSSLQLRLPDQLVSLKFPDGSVRLWTRVLGEVVQDHYRRSGREVFELQPCVRTCLPSSAP